MSPDELCECFPGLTEDVAAGIIYAFENWHEVRGYELLGTPSDEHCALIGFTAGWLARPTSDF